MEVAPNYGTMLRRATRTRILRAALGAAFAALAAGFAALETAIVAMASPASPDADALLRRAREVWAARSEVPYVQYGVRTRYEDAGRVQDTWYEITFRTRDGALALERIPQPGDEARLRGFALSIFGVTVFDTNPAAEVTAALRQPAIEPAFTFGLMPRGYRAHVAVPEGEPTPAPLPGELPEIGRVVVTNREYRVTLVGIERLRYGPAYHLALVPLRDPRDNRLRDLWIATDTYATLQETVAGILDVRPYDLARWTVTYVPLDGRVYIQQIRTDDSLRFGEQRVSHFQLDFVDYRFPRAVPAYTFEHWM